MFTGGDDMETDSVFTQLTLDPCIASTEHPVKVKWLVGADVKWQPNGNDEIRVFDTAGVLLSYEQMWNCRPLAPNDSYSMGEGTIVAPSTEGSYVVCLYDFPSKRRVFSSTFRVAGSKVGLPQNIDVKQAETPPNGRIDIAFNPKSLYGGYIALYQATDPDNHGINVHNASPFGASVFTVLAPTPDLLEDFDCTSLSFVAPSTPGNYQIRYLKTCRTGILRSVALSHTFTVRGEANQESISAQTVTGKLELPGVPQVGVKVGGVITVAWDVTEGLPVLSELDCIFLYPYGRPEAARQTDFIGTVTTAILAKWRAELEVPHEAGRYEVGYFSHRLQKFVLEGPSVLVVGEYASFMVDVHSLVSTVGEKVKIHWVIDELVHLSTDRYRIYDESMNMYGSMPITGQDGYVERGNDELAEASEVLFSRRSKGCIQVQFDRPGKYIAVYWSSLLQREVAKTESFKVQAPCDGTYPVKSLQVALTLPLRQPCMKPLCLLYNISGFDHPSVIERDCIAIYKSGDRDYVPSNYYNSVCESPAMRTFWVDGVASGKVELQPIETEGVYEARYLTPTGHGCWSAVVSYEFNVVKCDEIAVEQAQSLEQLAVSELSKARSQLTDDDGEGFLSSARSLQTESGPVANKHSQKKHGVILHVNPGTEFKGSIMVPKAIPLSEMIIATYHITGGYPISSDKLVLLDEGCTEIHAEADLENSLGREDFTLGTVLLRPPKVKGLYIVSYYSSKHRSLVLNSSILRATGHNNVKQQNIQERATSRNPPASLVRAGRLRALLVGAACHSSEYSLRGTANDTAIMAECLQEHFHVSPECIRILNESEQNDHTVHPTAYNIRKGIKWLLDGCRPKDHIVFYFSGLGSRMNNYGLSEADGYDCCLLPTDYDWRERCIKFSELRTDLYLAAPKGTEITVILDCCFVPNTLDTAVQRGIFHEDEVSGKAVHCAAHRLKQLRLKKGWDDRVESRCLVPPQGTFHSYCRCKKVSSRQMKEWDMDLGGLASLLHQAGATYDETTEHSGMWLLQACRDNELAAEKFIKGKYYGLFTWAFVQAVRDVRTNTCPANPLWYRTVINATQQVLSQWPYRQNPCLAVADKEDSYRTMFHLLGES